MKTLQREKELKESDQEFFPEATGKSAERMPREKATKECHAPRPNATSDAGARESACLA
ncbi:MAG: hypothetical protein LBR80_08125 [Deltaproteobacteria bacterium]|nr:hypothetical protein [Deltaproteobacteria bacterium]